MRSVLLVGVLALIPILAGGCGGSHRATPTTQDRRCSEVIFRAVPAHGQGVTAAGMQVARQIMANRLAKIGPSSPKVAIRGDEIVIQLAGVHDPAEVAKVVGTTGLLQFFDFEPSLAPPTATGGQQPAPVPSLYSLLSAVKQEAATGSPESYYLFKTTAPHPVLQGPAPNLHELLRPYEKGRQPPHTQVLKVPANREPVSCRAPSGCPGAGRTGRSASAEYWYLLKLPPALTGKDLVDSAVAADVDPNTGQAIVTLQLTGRGSKEFQRITKAEYGRGRVNAGLAGQLNPRDSTVISRYAGHNAIVLDGRLEQTPYIDYTNPALSEGIVGNAQITEPSAKAANRTALVLRSGSLPYRFQLVKRTSCPR